MTWEEYQEFALKAIHEKFPEAKNPEFMRSNGYEFDSQVYNIPSYVMFDV